MLPWIFDVREFPDSRAPYAMLSRGKIVILRFQTSNWFIFENLFGVKMNDFERLYFNACFGPRSLVILLLLSQNILRSLRYIRGIIKTFYKVAVRLQKSVTFSFIGYNTIQKYCHRQVSTEHTPDRTPRGPVQPPGHVLLRKCRGGYGIKRCRCSVFFSKVIKLVTNLVAICYQNLCQNIGVGKS